jgi:hypothetical protein
MAEVPGDRLHLDARRGLGGLHRRLVDHAAGEELVGKDDTPHAQALALARLVADAEDAFGGPAADVDHQARLIAARQAVRNAEVDQSGLFPAGDDFDVETQRGTRFFEEFRGVLGNPQRRGTHRTHRAGRHALDALADPRQAGQGALLRGLVEALVERQATRQAHGLLVRVQVIQLIPLHPRHLKMKTVRAEIDGGQGGIGRHDGYIVERGWRQRAGLRRHATASFASWSPLLQGHHTPPVGATSRSRSAASRAGARSYNDIPLHL